jgi:hypothetical protein
MEPKKAIAVLMDLLDKEFLSFQEKEAVLATIGALDSANLAENRMKGITKAKKAKRDKALEA